MSKSVQTVREFKGRSTLAVLDNFTVVDLETTGLDPKYDAIIELGAMKIKDMKVVSIYQSLLNPQMDGNPLRY